MTTNASTSQGVKLERGDGAAPTEAFTLIAEIATWNGPTETAKQIDVSSLDSTGHEYIVGLYDGGEVQISGNFVGNNAQQQGLRADMVGNVRRNFKLLLADAGTPTTFAFSAVITSFSIKGGVDKQVEFAATLKITGAVTPTYAT